MYTRQVGLTPPLEFVSIL